MGLKQAKAYHPVHLKIPWVLASLATEEGASMFLESYDVLDTLYLPGQQYSMAQVDQHDDTQLGIQHCRGWIGWIYG